MWLAGPIVVIEDDEDDQLFISRALRELDVKSKVLVYDSAASLIEYLSATRDQPFLIICDVNMPGVNGIALRRMINDNDFLRRKSIPFIFIATSDSQQNVNAAYELTIQGYFKKPQSFPELKQLLSKVVDYWTNCRHPNNLVGY